MPGIVGMIRLDGQPACIDAALAKLHHLPTYQSIKMQLTPAVSLGAIHRGESAHECDWHYHAERQVGILIIGIMICPEPHPHIISAQEVFDEYQTYGFNSTLAIRLPTGSHGSRAQERPGEIASTLPREWISPNNGCARVATVPRPDSLRRSPRFCDTRP
jgi:hypothetical protein